MTLTERDEFRRRSTHRDLRCPRLTRSSPSADLVDGPAPRTLNISTSTTEGRSLPGCCGRWCRPRRDAWLTAIEKYGTMIFEQVVTPALELAENGFPVSAYLCEGLQTTEDDHEGGVAMWPSTREIYMPNGRTPLVGEILVQADLARTFRRLIEAEQGASHLGREAALSAARDRFYLGDIAEEMIAFSDSQGGWITMEDWAEFSVKIEPPVSGQFREYRSTPAMPGVKDP